MGPTFDGGTSEPGPIPDPQLGREYALLRSVVFSIAAVAAILLPFAALGTAVLLDASTEGAAALVVAASAPLVAVLTAANKYFYGSTGIVPTRDRAN